MSESPITPPEYENITSDDVKAMDPESRQRFNEWRMDLANIPPDIRHKHSVSVNGAVILRGPGGGIVANPGGGISGITSASSRELREIYDRRRLEARITAQDSLRGVVIKSPKGVLLSGWRGLVEAQARLAMDTDRGRASTDAARFVGSATGFTSNDYSQAPAGDKITVSLPVNVLLDLAKHLKSVQDDPDSPVIDGQFTE